MPNPEADELIALLGEIRNIRARLSDICDVERSRIENNQPAVPDTPELENNKWALWSLNTALEDLDSAESYIMQAQRYQPKFEK